jgi:hypothetical protein
MRLEIQDLAWDRHEDVAGLNLTMGSQRSPLVNIYTVDNDFFSPIIRYFLTKTEQSKKLSIGNIMP